MVAITRYVTVALALIQSTAMAIGFGRQGYLIEFNALNVITTITALTAGSAFLMWVGERITEKVSEWYFHRTGDQHHFPTASRPEQPV